MQLEAVLHNPLKLVATVLLLLLCCAVFVLAAPSPEAATATVTAPQSIYISSNEKYNKDNNNFNENYQYDGNLVSGSSIYAYTVDDELSNSKQQQEQEPKYNKNNNYVINFAEANAKHNENNYKIRELTAKSIPTPTATTTTTTSTTKSTSAFSTILPTQPAPNTGCNYDRLAVYKVVLQTYWTRNLFPKHYPDWRPTAQWTKTIGRTHDASFALFHIGQQSSMGVKQFAETGKSEMLDNSPTEQQKRQSNGERNVFDEFNMPSIVNGGGRSEAKFFVDSNHSLVSLMTRIVPSPDWFIGVDSFQLCVGGSWIDTVTVEMDPLDAGTDNGFTFTAPNWPTSPQGVIYRITSRYPAHPAGSFFYPKNKRLPPIATFQFIKLKEYELSEVFNIVEDDRKYETVKTQVHLEAEQNNIELNELSASIERERQNELSVSAPTAESERDRIRSQLLAKMNPLNNASDSMNLALGANTYIGNIVPKNDKNAIMQNIAHRYQSNSLGKRRRTRRQRDCRVSHWSDWTACSKTCGIGEMHRYRKIIKHGKRGGRPCPALKESKWCGSEKGCHNTASYFNWSNT